MLRFRGSMRSHSYTAQEFNWDFNGSLEWVTDLLAG